MIVNRKIPPRRRPGRAMSCGALSPAAAEADVNYLTSLMTFCRPSDSTVGTGSSRRSPIRSTRGSGTMPRYSLSRHVPGLSICNNCYRPFSIPCSPRLFCWHIKPPLLTTPSCGHIKPPSPRHPGLRLPAAGCALTSTSHRPVFSTCHITSGMLLLFIHRCCCVINCGP